VCPFLETVLQSLWIHSPKQSFFLYEWHKSLGLLSLKGTLVLIPPCKFLTDAKERNRMVKEVFEKDKGGLDSRKNLEKKKEYLGEGG